MRRRFRQIDLLLITAALILAAGYYGTIQNGIRARDKWFDDKLKASRLMQLAMGTVREEKALRGIPVDLKEDINNTGLIGSEWSSITTTLGSLEAKRTSANPDFAAVVVDMLKEIGLSKGDAVAINFSGSFPALNIAVISAVETLELDASIISSAGASTWGANTPEFTYIDMEQVLYDKGLIKSKSLAVSLGGVDDVGKDMDPEAVRDLLERFRRQGRSIIYQKDFSLNIQERLKVYRQGGKSIRCFINVGGNLLSSGGSEDFTNIHTGIIRGGDYQGNHGHKGLIQVFLDMGIPVINLINIRELAVRYGVPIDPYPLSEAGEGEVFHDYEYPRTGIVLCLTAALVMVVFYGRRARV